MRKFLLIALLFWGCEGIGVFSHTHHTHDGVCAIRMSYHYVCYSKWTHKQCLSKSVNYTTQWYTDVTCEEFCKEESSIDCEINNEPKD